jgi:zinc transporter ZupT
VGALVGLTLGGALRRAGLQITSIQRAMLAGCIFNFFTGCALFVPLFYDENSRIIFILLVIMCVAIVAGGAIGGWIVGYRSLGMRVGR